MSVDVLAEITKQEVLQRLSVKLRCDDTPDLICLRLLGLYSQLSGWAFPIAPSPDKRNEQPPRS